MPDHAASPVSVLDVAGGTDPNAHRRGHARQAMRNLGIDPDMPVETLKRRLLWGERVEQMKPRLVGGLRGDEREQALTHNDLHRWLTRPDNPPSPASEDE